MATGMTSVPRRTTSLFAERRIVEIRMPTAKPGNTGSAAIVALLENKIRTGSC